MNEVVKVDNLVFSFDGKKDVLNNVSFSISKGEYVSLIGHNGSGKSTLAKLILGLLEANSGDIYLFGEKIDEKNIIELRKRCGIVFQNPDNQFIGSTVEDDIAFGLENRCVNSKEMAQIIREFADKVGMTEYLDKEPSKLSGGQKQRVAIAGVLALSPELIIFDESTSMLDPKCRKEIRDIIKELRRENKELTIISITHDVEEANISDRVIILDNGTIVSQGKPNEVFSKENSLEKYKLKKPFIYQITEALENEGFDVNNIETIEELEDLLCR